MTSAFASDQDTLHPPRLDAVAGATAHDAVVEAMLASRTWTPDTCVFRCDAISRILVRMCRDAGIDAQVLRLGPHRGPFPRMHPKWRAMTGNDADGACDGHHVVRIGDVVLDFTRLQFDDFSDVPHVTPVHALCDEWDGWVETTTP